MEEGRQDPQTHSQWQNNRGPNRKQFVTAELSTKASLTDTALPKARRNDETRPSRAVRRTTSKPSCNRNECCQKQVVTAKCFREQNITTKYGCAQGKQGGSVDKHFFLFDQCLHYYCLVEQGEASLREELQKSKRREKKRKRAPGNPKGKKRGRREERAQAKKDTPRTQGHPQRGERKARKQGGQKERKRRKRGQAQKWTTPLRKQLTSGDRISSENVAEPCQGLRATSTGIEEATNDINGIFTNLNAACKAST